MFSLDIFDTLDIFIYFCNKIKKEKDLNSIYYCYFFFFCIIYGLYINFKFFAKPFYFFDSFNVNVMYNNYMHLIAEENYRYNFFYEDELIYSLDDQNDEKKINNLKFFNIYINFYLLILIYYYNFCYYNLSKEESIVFFKLFNDFYFEFILNDITLILSFMVDIISTFIIFYSTWYMYFDKKKYYFLFLLYSFSLVMKLLIYSNSCLTFLICWEFVGLFSFLLISFWCNRIETRFASLKAFIINKVGDLFLLIGIINILIMLKFDNILLLKNNYNLFFNIYIFDIKFLNILCFCFLIAAIIKSAQFFVHIWLFDAMEGPTPVSALLHAATMVTAGVILILKFNFLFINNILFNITLNFFGIFSGIFGALMAITFFDIKKIIAGSTCSQIGLMMIALSSCSYMAAFFHLFIHAFFKALLFLTAGIFIHSKINEQDLRKLEALFYTNPLTTVSFFIASFSLMGFPYTSGYFSKDFIFESFFFNKDFLSFFNIYCFLFISILSCYYSFRIFNLMLFKSFWDKNYFDKKKFFKIYYFKDTYNNLIIFILIIFNLLVITSGFFSYKYFRELNLYFFYDINNYINSLYFVNNYFFLILLMPFFTYLFFFIFLIIKRYFFMHYFWVALFYFRRINYRFYIDEIANFLIKLKILYIYYFFYKFLALRFYIDLIYIESARYLFFYSYYLYLYIDRGFIEYIFQIFFIKIFYLNMKKKTRLFLNNYSFNFLIYIYIFFIFLFFLLICYVLGFFIFEYYML